MKLSAGRIHDAVQALNGIMQSPNSRKVPQIAKYRLARMHAILEKEATLIEAERSKLVMELGEEVFLDPEKTKSGGWRVDQANVPKFTEYVKRWTEIRAQELEVTIEPITLTTLGDSAEGLEVDEFKALGELIAE